MNIEALIRAGLVPYITSWSGERHPDTWLTAGSRTGIGYDDEQLGDRDGRGILWVRQDHAPGEGVPEFSAVHPHRQRRAMQRLLCQVCAGPADKNEQGILWLLGQADKAWPGAETTAQPPVCLDCAGPASRTCPHLRGRTLALRVRRAPVIGVTGTLYRMSRGAIHSLGQESLLYGDPRCRWLRAGQLLRELRDCTVVDLDQELREAKRQ